MSSKNGVSFFYYSYKKKKNILKYPCKELSEDVLSDSCGFWCTLSYNNNLLMRCVRRRGDPSSGAQVSWFSCCISSPLSDRKSLKACEVQWVMFKTRIYESCVSSTSIAFLRFCSTALLLTLQTHIHRGSKCRSWTDRPEPTARFKRAENLWREKFAFNSTFTHFNYIFPGKGE